MQMDNEGHYSAPLSSSRFSAAAGNRKIEFALKYTF